MRVDTATCGPWLGHSYRCSGHLGSEQAATSPCTFLNMPRDGFKAGLPALPLPPHVGFPSDAPQRFHWGGRDTDAGRSVIHGAPDGAF